MPKIEITSVKVNKLEDSQSGRIIAVANVVINDCFIVNDIRVIKTDDKVFCSMPNRKLVTGEFRDICHPLDQETRKYIEDSILKKLEEV